MPDLGLTVVLSAGPHVELLDATSRQLGADGLRNRARARGIAGRRAYVVRSYRYPFALIAWHTERVGVDIERVETYDQAFAESICTPAERSATLPTSAEDLASLWCAKEALSKALGDATRYDPRRLSSPACWQDGKSGPWRTRTLDAPAGYVAWICWRT